MNNYEIMMNGNVKIGEFAPEFEATTTMGNIKLSDYKGKWLILFSHPGDFTPVCTTEMIAFTKAHTYFKNLNTELLGLSVDSNSSHLAWVYDIYCKTGVKVSFPIIADRNGEIARKYGMIVNDISNTETVRNVFVIDDKGIRIVQALQMAECAKGSTPANWIPNQPVIVPAPKTFEGLLERNEEIEKNRNGMSWYLSFKEPPKECIEENEKKKLE